MTAPEVTRRWERARRVRGQLALLLICLKSVKSGEKRQISHAEEFQIIYVAALPLRGRE